MVYFTVSYADSLNILASVQEARSIQTKSIQTVKRLVNITLITSAVFTIIVQPLKIPSLKRSDKTVVIISEISF